MTTKQTTTTATTMKSQTASNRLQHARSRPHCSGAQLGAKQEGEGDGGGQLSVNKQHQVQQVIVNNNSDDVEDDGDAANDSDDNNRNNNDNDDDDDTD